MRTYLYITPTAESDYALCSTKSTEIVPNGRWTGACSVGSFGRLYDVFGR